MSTMTTPIQQYLSQRQPDRARTPGSDADLETWKRRRQHGKRDRTRYEPDWYLCQSYAANKQWVGWSNRLRRVLSMLDDPREKDREHHTENILTSYLWTAVSQLVAEDLLPELTFRKEDVESQMVTDQANLALRYAYEEELDGEDVLMDVILGVATYGTMFGQVMFQRGVGEDYGRYPLDASGQFITGTDEVAAHEKMMLEQGQLPRYDVLRGQLVWGALSPFNVFTPPGVEYWRKFPWLIVEAAYPTDQVRAMFPEAAGQLSDQDLQAIDAIGLRELAENDTGTAGAKLEGHVLLSTGYEMPSATNPDGRVFYWTQDVKLGAEPQLPFEVNRRRVAGIAPFRYRRVKGRFWGMGIVEPAIGVQRQRNRARSQHIEIKDRAGLGRVYAPPGAITGSSKPRGRIMEVIEVQPAYLGQIQETSGTGPGPWIKDEVEMLDSAMDRVTGFGPVSALGAPPANMAAYASMALSKQADEERNRPIVGDFRRGVDILVKATVCGIRLYWPPSKQIVSENPSGEMASFMFDKAQLPMEVYTRVAKGSSRPQSPAALTQLCFDLYDRSVSGGQVLPFQWLFDSVVKEGRPLPLPHTYQDLQRGMAEYENILLRDGKLPAVRPFDDDRVHLEVHQQGLAIVSLQAQAQPELQQVAALFLEHIQEHQTNMQQKVTQATSAPGLQGPMGALGGATPGGPAPAGLPGG